MSSPTLFVAPVSKWLPYEETLVSVINRGYDKPRFKYGVVLTPRINCGMLTDLVIDKPEQAYMMVCLAPKGAHGIKATDSASTVTEKLISSYPTGKFDMANIRTCDDLDEISKAAGDGTLESRILGTVCVKECKDRENTGELTAFTSFYPKLSPILLENIDSYCLKNTRFKHFYLEVIEEHELVPYYRKQGFELMGEEECAVDPETHCMVSDPLEEGFRASRNIHLAKMIKSID